jgi:hypothetical protein
VTEGIIPAVVTGIFGIIAVIIGCFLTRSFTKKEFQSKEIKNTKLNRSLISCDYAKIVLQAKECIFFNGIVLATLADMDLRNSLIKVDPRININFVSANLNDSVIFESARRYWGTENDMLRSMGDNVLTWIKTIKKAHQNTNHNYSNICIFTSYFAIDYKDIKETSFIQAKYYLLNKSHNEVNVFYITTRPGDELYEIYREQIKLIENKNGEVGYI